jgi:GNAT superfamily N-acetyltransferase
MSCAEHDAHRRETRGARAPFTLAAARSAADVEAVRTLFRQYGQTPGVEVCVAGFDEEIAGLPAPYAEPRGTILLAIADGGPAGCVGIKPMDGEVAEMKRLFVTPGVRGRRIGEALAVAAIDAARSRGYARLRLETLPSMVAARALYARLGFSETKGPAPGIHYLELTL